MGVNWQSNNVYQGLKDYEKESGTTLAERNAMVNPYGSHSFGGLLISQLLPTLIMGGAQTIAGTTGLNGSSETGSETDVTGNTSDLTKFTLARQKYDNAVRSGNQADIKKYAQELQQIGEAGVNANNPTIMNVYKGEFRTKIETHAKQT